MARRKDEVAWADPTLLILGSLVDGPKHGYAIIQHTEQDTGVILGPGTLYAALSRLEERGMVRALPGEARRRPYEITVSGVELLRTRLAAMHSFTAGTLSRLNAVNP
jgi:DNA-binding PadR family transcriptional regulator